MKHNCGDCNFFHPIRDIGECRRNPPAYDPEYKTENNFPIVSKTAWCGEFKPRKADKDETKG